MKKSLISMAILIICTLTIMGLATAAIAAPKKGGIAKLAVASNPHSLGFPATQVGRDVPTASHCIESLFSTDSKGNLVPKLAIDYKSDPASKTIVINLRKGVKFHDGSDFNAEVAKWNLEMFNQGARKELKEITSIDINDKFTITLHLKEYNNTLINHFTQAPGQMISKIAFDTNGKDWAEKTPIGTGPFKFVSWKNDVGVKYERNDNYWDGQVYLDGLEIIYYPDGNVALLDLQAGNLQTLMMPLEAYQGLKESGKFIFLHGVDGKPGAIASSVMDPKSPFNDQRVRQAVSYALDAQIMADTFGYGTYQVANQWATPGSPFYNPNIKTKSYDPKKAKKLLAEAGYPKGFDTTFTFLLHRPSVMDIATAVQSYLQVVGIRVKLVPLKSASFNDVATLGKGFDGLLMLMGRVFTDPLQSVSIIATGREYHGMLKHPDFIDIYKNAVMAPDFETKKELVWKMSYLMTEKHDMITMLWVTTSIVAVDNRLKGVDVTGESYLAMGKAWFDN